MTGEEIQEQEQPACNQKQDSGNAFNVTLYLPLPLCVCVHVCACVCVCVHLCVRVCADRFGIASVQRLATGKHLQ